MSIYSSKIFTAVFSAQQHYSEHVSHHCCVDVLLMSLSWDTYISHTQYSSLLHSVSVFHFSRANMLTVLLMILITFLTDLTLIDLIFRTDSDEFINLLIFKIILTDSV